MFNPNDVNIPDEVVIDEAYIKSHWTTVDIGTGNLKDLPVREAIEEICTQASWIIST